ncbi:MAG: NAD-dependent epimerase/dehydratase family protein [Propionibacteriales bacterium]|nr:NAD-dependent epimerase/dehydratase family protein [Propionibacteriales bacterium]
MRILVLGGTAWLSRQIAADATSRGHDVVCAARGVSGAAADGVRLVRVDRDDADALAPLADEQWDAVIDVTRLPSHARSAVSTLAGSTKQWLYVSTISVYAEHDAAGQGIDGRLLEAAGPDADESNLELYGELKRACEVAVETGIDRPLIVRPGLVVGPGDPSGRFAYWPRRFAQDDTVVAPGTPGDAVQVIDVRDLAAWLVDLVERGTTGVFNGVGPRVSRAEFHAAVAAGVGRDPELVWADHERLTEEKVEMWMGPRSVPLWVPEPEYSGHMSRDVSDSVAAGLTLRPLADTARDTLTWLGETPDAKVTGLTDDEHAELLAALRA